MTQQETIDHFRLVDYPNKTSLPQTLIILNIGRVNETFAWAFVVDSNGFQRELSAILVVHEIL